MPQVEILADVPRSAVANAVTSVLGSSAFRDQVAQCVAEAFNVVANTVGVFVLAHDDSPARREEAQHGQLGRARPRVLVKVHALARPKELRAGLASNLTSVTAEHYAIHPKDVAIYFFERAAEEIAYSGLLVG